MTYIVNLILTLSIIGAILLVPSNAEVEEHENGIETPSNNEPKANSAHLLINPHAPFYYLSMESGTLKVEKKTDVYEKFYLDAINYYKNAAHDDNDRMYIKLLMFVENYDMDWREKANAFQLKYLWEVINNYMNALSNGKIIPTIVGVVSLTDRDVLDTDAIMSQRKNRNSRPASGLDAQYIIKEIRKFLYNNKATFNETEYDMFVYMTRSTLSVKNKRKFEPVQGWAGGKFCLSQNNANTMPPGLIMENSIQYGYAKIAQLLAKSIGIDYDDKLGCPDGFIMGLLQNLQARNLTNPDDQEKFDYQWSECSKSKLNTVLSDTKLACLHTKPAFLDTTPKPESSETAK
ncbi:uncharacterized protein LOC130667611 [Microplitis mediator]|uniref:uncharacterized protein LOC130667611 n=1 Tax=Microplitis mediator TaxID=375433 RepID=UPI0025542D4F|nr:uncharacterized protein LOC130667611 [Microplitis mediator]